MSFKFWCSQIVHELDQLNLTVQKLSYSVQQLNENVQQLNTRLGKLENDLSTSGSSGKLERSKGNLFSKCFWRYAERGLNSRSCFFLSSFVIRMRSGGAARSNQHSSKDQERLVSRLEIETLVISNAPSRIHPKSGKKPVNFVGWYFDCFWPEIRTLHLMFCTHALHRFS